MILIVGLGNPGKKYEKTRHNVGFRIVDSLDFGHSTELSRGPRDKDIILLKPDAFMNESGKAVQKTLAYYKIPASNLIVIHDDIDLPLGAIRVSQNVSSAGHKGVQSIINALGTKDFTRIRIGIRPKEKPAASYASRRARQNENLLAGFVLEKFTKEEEEILERVIKEAVEIIKTKI